MSKITINGKECQVLEEKQESLLDEGKYYIYNSRKNNEIT